MPQDMDHDILRLFDFMEKCILWNPRAIFFLMLPIVTPKCLLYTSENIS